MYRTQRAARVIARQSSRTYFTNKPSGDVRVQRVRLLRPVHRGRLIPRVIFWAIAINVAWMSLQRRMDAAEEEDEEEQDSVSVKEAVKQARMTAQTEQVGAGGQVSAGTDEQVQALVTEVVSAGEDDEEDEDELVPEEPPDDAWFIPLWFAQEMEKEYYTADDPEWISFVEFNQDMQHRRAVKHAIVKFIYEKYINTRKIQQNMGVPIKVGRVWLEFYYPFGPPPDWERLGIEITDDYVALLHRPVDAGSASRVQTTLLPKRALLSFWDSLQALWQMKSSRVQEAWESAEDELAKRDAPKNTTRTPDLSNLPSNLDSATKDTPSRTTPSFPVPTKGSGSNDQRISLPLPTLPQPSAELKEAMLVFRRSFAKNAMPKDAAPPRGSLLCAGLVEFVGTRDILVMDIQAFYDPTRHAVHSMELTLQSARPVHLRPKMQHVESRSPGGTGKASDGQEKEDEGREE